MKNLIINILGVALLIVGCSEEHAPSYESQVKQFRKNKTKLFKSPSSPLLEEERAHFLGLSYFPVDSVYRIKAIYSKAERQGSAQEYTDGTSEAMFVLGYLQFEWQNEPQELLITVEDINAPNKGLLAFNDATNGHETYGGGRYINLNNIKDTSGQEIDWKTFKTGTVFLDFNYAYFPYCAYNYKFVCPVPHVANRLTFKVNAGEKF